MKSNASRACVLHFVQGVTKRRDAQQKSRLEIAPKPGSPEAQQQCHMLGHRDVLIMKAKTPHLMLTMYVSE